MTEEEYADFTERLKHYDMSQAEFIRQAITRATIRPIVTVSPVNDEPVSYTHLCRAGRTHRKAKFAPLSRKSGAMPPLRNWTSCLLYTSSFFGKLVLADRHRTLKIE